MATKLFIVDDHYMIIEGIRSLVQNEEIEWIGHAMSAASCLAFLKTQLPDIILMDINLPDKSGIDLCREVKEKYPSVFIIGLSTFNQQSFIEKMMDNGASGYVLKNVTQGELIRAIEMVLKGKLFLSDEAAQTLKKSKEATIVLTRREKEILELIAEGLTNSGIAEKLFISQSTVDTHRKNILIKFGVNNTAHLIKKAATLNFFD
jgi:DNA-binding NarL/FixJ family response regulator